MTPGIEARYEPINWLLVFSPSTTIRWIDRVLPGRFKHVMACAYATEAKAWVFYEVTLLRTQIFVMPEAAGDRFFAGRLADHGTGVLRIGRQNGHWSRGRIGTWCVPAVKRLIGLRSGALRPDGLWRDCVAAGAEIVHDPQGAVLPPVTAGNRGAERCRERQDFQYPGSTAGEHGAHVPYFRRIIGSFRQVSIVRKAVDHGTASGPAAGSRP